MNKTIILSFVLILSSCYHEGPTLTEDGKITATVFNPGQDFSTTGISTSGNMHLSSGRTDDSYAVVIECKHGSFAVKHKEIFEKVHVGDKVVIWYKEKLDDNNVVLGYSFMGLEVKH